MKQLHVPVVVQCSATSLPYPDNYFEAVITDPPYYDNVPYSYLSDFFYVWLKHTIGDLYPELFATPLTPKTEEIVVGALKVILFGSFARGDVDVNSDLDLLVLMPSSAAQVRHSSGEKIFTKHNVNYLLPTEAIILKRNKYEHHT